MAERQGWFQRAVGGLVNAALPGTPYSRYSGYNPTLTRNSIISGVAGQIVPGGGVLANSILGQTGGAQAATAGQQGLSGLMGAYELGNQSWQQSNENFDSSGIRPDYSFAFDAPTPDPSAPQQPQSMPGQAEPTQLAGLVGNGVRRRDTRSGSSAGSSVLAEGAAAQNMVEGWQLGNWLGMRAPTGPGQAYTRQA